MGQMAKYFLRFTGNLIYDYLRNKTLSLTIRPGWVRQFDAVCFWGIFWPFLDKKKAKLAFLNLFSTLEVGKFISIIIIYNIKKYFNAGTVKT
jgi:hypothetical protein